MVQTCSAWSIASSCPFYSVRYYVPNRMGFLLTTIFIRSSKRDKLL